MTERRRRDFKGNSLQRKPLDIVDKDQVKDSSASSKIEALEKKYLQSYDEDEFEDFIVDAEASISELRQGLRIDINHLHIVAANQSDYYDTVGELSADVKYQAKNAKLILDQMRAQLGLLVRENFEQYGITRLTEGAVLSAVVSHRRIKKLNSIVLRLERLQEVSSNLVSSVDSRRSMIKVESDLFGSSYWNIETNVSKEIKSAGREQAISDIIAQRRAKKK